jgi:opacity protein-like surface antigen
MKRWSVLLAGLAFLFVAMPAEETEAQVTFGPQAIFWDLDRPGVGARVDIGLADSFGIDEGFFEELKASINGSYVFGESESFPGGSASWNVIVINANAVVPFEVDAAITPFAGAGINHTRFSSSISNGGFGGFGFTGTFSGLNLLGGIEFGLGDLPSFAELQYSTSGAGYLTLGFGVMFGG